MDHCSPPPIYQPLPPSPPLLEWEVQIQRLKERRLPGELYSVPQQHSSCDKGLQSAPETFVAADDNDPTLCEPLPSVLHTGTRLQKGGDALSKNFPITLICSKSCFCISSLSFSFPPDPQLSRTTSSPPTPPLVHPRRALRTPPPIPPRNRSNTQLQLVFLGLDFFFPFNETSLFFLFSFFGIHTFIYLYNSL